MNETNIVKITGREILDSRGNPTVEAEIVLADGTVARGAAPSGASTGVHEALELRDGDKKRYRGKGTLKAAGNISEKINGILVGKDARDIYEIDRLMIEADGTPDRSGLGANAILAVSIAAVRAASKSLKVPLYRHLGGVSAVTLPVPMMNILNGGAHANNNIDIQEFMIMPVGAVSFREALRWCSEVYHELAALLNSAGRGTAVGDEGGFAPDLEDEEAAMELLLEAVERAGYKPGSDFMLALDAAASEWKTDVSGKYRMPKSGMEFTSPELISHWKKLCEKYPILSIEDGLDEEDWDGWELLTSELGNKIQLVGDDLFVTNTRRLSRGISRKCGNSILIKPNQTGTISETAEAVRLAKEAGYTAIASHRSGETGDTTIADISVGFTTCQIKTGSPCRGERTEKYNRLLRIEAELGKSAVYPGRSAFRISQQK